MTPKGNLSTKVLSSSWPGCISFGVPLTHIRRLYFMMGARCLEGKINVVESHRSNNMTGKWICKIASSKWKAHPSIWRADSPS